MKPDLTGCRVLVSRARPGPSCIASRLRSYGVEVVEAPEVFVEELADRTEFDQVLLERHQYRAMIFACSTSVESVMPRLHQAVTVPVIAIGEQARDALHQFGVTPAITTKGACHPELQAHLSHLANARVVLFCSTDGRQQLKQELAALKIDIRSIAVYRHMYRFPEHIRSRFDAVVVPGSSAAALVLNSEWGNNLKKNVTIAMGKQSAHAAKRCGAENVIQAEQDTVDAIVDCTVKQLMKHIDRTSDTAKDSKESVLEEMTGVQTKRLVLAQVNVCNGCCCGRVDKKRPEVPLDWLKTEWKSRGLLKRVQLSISGCLGPCDVANVVMITSSQGTQWLGGLNCQRHYDLLADWAEQSKNADQLQPLPHELRKHAMVTYREQDALTFEEIVATVGADR